MKIWEYLTVYYGSEDDNSSMLDGFGEVGWKLIQVIAINGKNFRWIFMREKVERNDPKEVD